MGVIHPLEEVDIKDGDGHGVGLRGLGEPGSAADRPGKHVVVGHVLRFQAQPVELGRLFGQRSRAGRKRLNHLLHLLLSLRRGGHIAANAVRHATGRGRRRVPIDPTPATIGVAHRQAQVTQPVAVIYVIRLEGRGGHLLKFHEVPERPADNFPRLVTKRRQPGRVRGAQHPEATRNQPAGVAFDQAEHIDREREDAVAPFFRGLAGLDIPHGPLVGGDKARRVAQDLDVERDGDARAIPALEARLEVVHGAIGPQRLQQSFEVRPLREERGNGCANQFVWLIAGVAHRRGAHQRNHARRIRLIEDVVQ